MTTMNTAPSSFLNKSLVTNLIAMACILVGLGLQDPLRSPIFNMGLFALSGAITNWLAIHMLFEKVPGLYGSGIIPAHFLEFKASIHDLMMTQFFSQENIEKFFAPTASGESKLPFDVETMIDQTDLDPAYEALVSAIENSSFGGMLNMVGGIAALEPLKDSFIDNMKAAFKEIFQSPTVQETVKKAIISPVSDDILEKVGVIVEKRLDELTPQMVKEIIQNMIREHLGWLVVWGGVFGALIGLLTNYLPF